MLPSFSLENINTNTTIDPNTTPNINSTQFSEQPTEQIPIYRYGFFMVDNEIIRNYGGRIGPYAISVYNVLSCCADSTGTCFPSISYIANNTGMGETSVRQALKVLQKEGLLEITSRYNEDGRQRSNLYILLPIEKAPPLSTQMMTLPDEKEGSPHEPYTLRETKGEDTSREPKRNPSYLYTSERELERNTTREKPSNTEVNPTPVETVVVGDSSTPTQDISDLNHPEQEEHLNYVLNRFTELTDKEQPNSRELIQLRELSRYAKDTVVNTFDAALEWATNPHKAPIRDAAAWLLGTAKRMEKRGGTPVKPRTEEPTSEDYRRFNRENGGVLLGLSGSVEEGGSYQDEVETKVEAEVKVEPQPQPQSLPPTEEQKEVLAFAKEQMKGEINSITYGMAIEPLTLIAVEGERYILQAPSPSMLQFLQQNGIGHVKRVFRDHLGQPRAIIDFQAASQPEPIDPTRRRYR